jgi:hypothetical protein
MNAAAGAEGLAGLVSKYSPLELSRLSSLMPRAIS